MANHLCGCCWVLTLGQALEMLGFYRSREAPLLGKFALPFAANAFGFVLAVVALIGVGEFLGVVSGGLAGSSVPSKW